MAVGDSWANAETVNITLTGQPDAPDTPTAVTLTEVQAGIRINWTAPAQQDLAYIGIWRNTSDSFPGGSPRYKPPAAPGEAGAFTDRAVSYDQTYYYWLKAFNHSDIASDPTTSVNGSPTRTDWNSDINGSGKPDDNATVGADWGTNLANIPDGIYQIFYQANGPGSGMSTGDYWIDSDDNKIYRYDGSWSEIQDSGIASALADAATAQATADGKVVTFVQTGQPTADGAGDLWFDSDDDYKVYRWSGSAWIAVFDSRIAQAISDAAAAQATADGKVVTFYQDAQPTADGAGDLWIDTNDGNKLYRWSGSAWQEIQDDDIAQAISDAATAQSTADGKIVTYYQDAQPTADGTGDLWVDTNDGNKLYRWSGSAWQSVRDATIAAAQADATTAISDAAAAQATADGKIITYYQDAQPTADGTGDLWIDTNDGNKLYRWSGSAWQEIQDDDIAQAISDAATAQSTADGKIVTYYQDAAPTADGTGDLWFDTNDDNKPYRWSGSAWQAVEFDVADWAKVFGDNKPANNATVGANWSLNLSSIPATLATPDAEGLYVSDTYLGYYTGEAWRTFIKDDGTIYGGDGSGEYFQYVPGSGVEISTANPNAITIKAGGSIALEAGGDVNFGLSDTNPSLLNWGDFYYMGAASSAGRGLCFWPETTQTGYVRIGWDPVNNSKKPFDSFLVFVNNYAQQQVMLGENYSELVQFDSSIMLQCYTGDRGKITITGGEIATRGVVYPEYTSTDDLGKSDKYWKDGYIDRLYLDATFYIEANVTPDPILSFDTNDYLYYDRTTNQYKFVVDSTLETYIGTDSFWVNGHASFGSHSDRSKQYIGLDALAQLKPIKGKLETAEGDWSDVDHNSLPDGVKIQVKGPDGVERSERDIGAFISLISKAVLELSAKIDTLEIQ